MKILLSDLNALCGLFKHVPPETPSRFETMHQLAVSIGIGKNDCHPSKMITILLHNNECVADEEFVLSKAMLLRMSHNITLLKEFKQKVNVLLPTNLRCCSKVMAILSDYASTLIYSEHGVSEGRLYHGKCRVCKTIHYHGYKINKISGEIEFVDNSSKYLIFNTGIAFTRNFMEHANNIICIGGVSFEKTALIMTRSYNLEPCLNPDRLETAWFIYRIKEFQTMLRWPRKEKSKELDLEEMCRRVYNGVKSAFETRWLNHICEDKGCRGRYVVIDGNEKMFRSICSAPKIRIIGKKR